MKIKEPVLFSENINPRSQVKFSNDKIEREDRLTDDRF